MVGGLQIRRRAEREAFLAVPALLRGYFRDEIDLPSCASVKKPNGVFLLDFCTVSHAETAKNAKGGLFLETVLVRAILLGQILQCRGIRGMCQKLLQENLASFIYLLGPGSDYQIWLYRGDAGSNEICPTASFCLYGANSASPIWL